jgi:hypothetical protein
MAENPTSADDIARAAGIRIVWWGSERLIRCEDAVAFLDACEQQSVRILGVEGFDLADDNLYPDMGIILDLSTLLDARASVAQTRRFVEAVARPGLLLDFVLDPDR